MLLRNPRLFGHQFNPSCLRPVRCGLRHFFKKTVMNDEDNTVIAGAQLISFAERGLL